MNRKPNRRLPVPSLALCFFFLCLVAWPKGDAKADLIQTLPGDSTIVGAEAEDAVAQEPGPLAVAVQALNKGDSRQAAELLEPLANDGIPEAQFLLGLLYQQGRGVEPSEKQAIVWYKKSSLQGFAPAMLNLGLIELEKAKENKTPNSAKRALQMFEHASKAGDARGDYYQGLAYNQGQVVNKDPVKAFVFFQRAADAGLPVACNLTGQHLLKGIGTAKDEQKAFSYFKRAAEKGWVLALYNIGICYKQGLGTEKNAPQAARSFLLAARSGFVPAFAQIGACYVNGDGILMDEISGANWLDRGARVGNGLAQHMLAQLYLTGTGVEQNLNAALKLFILSSRSGNPEARHALAQLLAQGLGLPENKPNLVEAHAWALVAGDSIPSALEYASKLAEKLSDEEKELSTEFQKKIREADETRKGSDREQ
ncbi:putative beta-lactamase HcpC precursor [Planctomycetes bacterium CA13]|uniref:Putative beta-lactamase HcpC n=1 Tax=Novipirellula herctigrandis TaxID=2527986 RepID=A0A5C5Z955_9BACT|nr:putative beta-lactamase HcpC precursor [Planctomycetes bacterium CA13]